MNAARISAERKAGQLLKEIERSKAGRPVENNSVGGSPNPLDGQKTTPCQQAKEQAHISDYQAKRWQQLAARQIAQKDKVASSLYLSDDKNETPYQQTKREAAASPGNSLK